MSTGLANTYCNPNSSVFVDISSRPENEPMVIQIAKQQFPNSMGVIPHCEGKRQVLLEFAFDDETDLKKALTVKREFPKSKTRIISARGMPNKDVIRKLHLSHLPLVWE
ncbi:hypothetical protein BDC45DRAFT_573799 [Circinella umbellata]|nr:hypothetical protein BDC45DRAFT_573799 [Circinella umbellata]